jgi:hypothetical protein
MSKKNSENENQDHVSVIYRPEIIEFDLTHDGSCIPASLGNYKTADEAQKFMGQNLVGVPQALTTGRIMDFTEKTNIRKSYDAILENKVPVWKDEVIDCENELATAKENLKVAREKLDSAIEEATMMAMQVKRGVVEIKLDDAFTWRVPYKGKYYFFTYIDKELKLAHISSIPETEKQEIWNAMARNEEFFDANFPV